MATLVTKYSIGDVVYHATTVTERKRRDCPDCLGARKWKATSPAGREYDFGCPRCSADYISDRDISLDYSAHAPRASRLTIGQVRVEADTAQETSYMCVETGIGGGLIYYEKNLFPTEEEALAAAKIMAAEADKAIPWVVELFNKSLKISDYQLSDATAKLAKDRYDAAAQRMSYILDDLRDCYDFDDVKRLIARYADEKVAA